MTLVSDTASAYSIATHISIENQESKQSSLTSTVQIFFFLILGLPSSPFAYSSWHDPKTLASLSHVHLHGMSLQIYKYNNVNRASVSELVIFPLSLRDSREGMMQR